MPVNDGPQSRNFAPKPSKTEPAYAGHDFGPRLNFFASGLPMVQISAKLSDEFIAQLDSTEAKFPELEEDQYK